MKGGGLLIMSKVVLDASALLVLLHQEKGSEQVVEPITEAIICSARRLGFVPQPNLRAS